jgi:DNA-binding NarL/FixJ family response regulator
MGRDGDPAGGSGTSRTPISVVIADDADLVRRMTAELIATDDAFVVVAEVDDAPGAIAVAQQCRPDIAVLDVNMPGGGGVHAATAIHDVSPRTRVVAYSVYDDETTRGDMYEAGVVAYVVKGRDALLDVLRQVCGRPA